MPLLIAVRRIESETGVSVRQIGEGMMRLIGSSAAIAKAKQELLNARNHDQVGR